ncbi:MAG: helix-turn-helix domain-containing protein [Rhodococcus sp. (in: high G+C Gram-positive bacteria)]|uniref:helix-turn-helix domain-containing protein n=1 Tax=Rhodococcus sp. TaxID=1831 RepID=UPI003BB80B35
MSQGSESAPQDYLDVAALIEELADNGESVGIVALPETAPSFVFVDCRWGDSDTPARSLGSDRLHEALGRWMHGYRLSPLRPLGDAARRAFTVWVADPKRDTHQLGLPFAVTMLAADSSPDAAAEADADEWGPAIPDEEAATLEQANLKLQVEHRRQELSASMSRTEAANLLGVSPQTVSEWVAQHKLVGLKDGREWRFPAWQFTPDNAEPVLPDLDRLVAAFPGGEVSLSRWMNRSNDNFAGRTPAQEMARDSDHVIAIVETLVAT